MESVFGSVGDIFHCVALIIIGFRKTERLSALVINGPQCNVLQIIKNYPFVYCVISGYMIY